MSGRLPLVAWLVAVWVAFWDDLSVANVVGGACVAALLLAVLPGWPPGPGLVLRPLPALRFLGYLAVSLVEANLVVTREIVTPGSGINEGIVAVRLQSESEVLVTLVVNAIGLAPGTLVVEVEPCPGGSVLYVHVLHLHDLERVRRDVQHLEDLALRAFAPAGPAAT